MAAKTAPRALTYWSGRVALFAVLRALGIGPGAEIIAPVYTCPAVIEPIIGIGARPVYGDIEEMTLGLSLTAVRAAVTERTRAIIIQHTFGMRSACLEKILALANEHGIPVLEDCCHVCRTHASTPQLGRYGLAAFYSYGRQKPLSVGVGGELLLNSRACRAQAERQYSEFTRRQASVEAWSALSLVAADFRRFFRARVAGLHLRKRSGTTGDADHDPYPVTARLGAEYGWKMPWLAEWRLGLALRRLERRIATKQQKLLAYETGLRRAGIRTHRAPPDPGLVFWRYPIYAANKQEALAHAAALRVPLTDWGAKPLQHLIESNRGADGYPVAQRIVRTLVTLRIDENEDPPATERNLAALARMHDAGVL